MRQRQLHPQLRTCELRLHGATCVAHEGAIRSLQYGSSHGHIADIHSNCEGLAGLWDRAKPGRPRKLDAAQEAEFARIVLAGPDPELDGISAYTLEDLAGIAKTQFKASYHPWSVSRVIKRLGFSRQKARPYHPKKDEASQEAFKKMP